MIIFLLTLQLISFDFLFLLCPQVTSLSSRSVQYLRVLKDFIFNLFFVSSSYFCSFPYFWLCFCWSYLSYCQNYFFQSFYHLFFHRLYFCFDQSLLITQIFIDFFSQKKNFWFSFYFLYSKHGFGFKYWINQCLKLEHQFMLLRPISNLILQSHSM